MSEIGASKITKFSKYSYNFDTQRIGRTYALTSGDVNNRVTFMGDVANGDLQ